MSDADGDSSLSCGEFALAMHMTVGVSKRGMSLPAALPIALAAAVGAPLPALGGGGAAGAAVAGARAAPASSGL